MPDMERVLARADTAVTTIQMRVTFRLREDVRHATARRRFRVA